MNQQVEQVIERTVLPQIGVNTGIAGAAKAMGFDLIFWLTVTLIALQVIWWVWRLGKEFGWWGKKEQ